MKILTNTKTTVKDGKVTITGDVAEKTFGFPVQQVTVGYLNPDNMRWPRHIQLSGEAVFVKAFGRGFAIMNEDLTAIAAAIEPLTSYPPTFQNQPDDKLTADISSELSPDIQWEVTDSILAGEVNWQPVTGATTATLDKSLVKSGQFVRCVATSESGMMASNAVQVK